GRDYAAIDESTTGPSADPGGASGRPCQATGERGVAARTCRAVDPGVGGAFAFEPDRSPRRDILGRGRELDPGPAEGAEGTVRSTRGGLGMDHDEAPMSAV